MKTQIQLTILWLFILSSLSTFSQNDTTKCGTWRWSIKTLTDTAGIPLLTKQPIPASIDSMVLILPPKILKASSRKDGKLPRYTREKQVVEITAYVTEILTEADHDLHFVLKSPTSDKTMVGEIPDPTCPDYDNNPTLRAHFTQTRIDGMKVKDKWKETKKNPVKVKITGVPFWDGVHSGNVTGSSKYFREIHPILSIEIQ
ncbi:MAG: hypothetical protein WCK09_13830 [Bacteroidota bacterium]